MADEAADDREAGGFDDGLDGVRDVADAVSDDRLGDAGGERVLGDVEEPLRLGLDLADAERVGAVGDVAVERHADVDGDEVALGRPRIDPGMPWTTTSLVEMQIAFGYSRPRCSPPKSGCRRARG